MLNKQLNTLFFYIRRSNFGADAERFVLFCDLRLKTFSNLHGIQGQLA